jgi:hypothetical protein
MGFVSPPGVNREEGGKITSSDPHYPFPNTVLEQRKFSHLVVNNAVCISSPNSLFPDSAPRFIGTSCRRPGQQWYRPSCLDSEQQSNARFRCMALKDTSTRVDGPNSEVGDTCFCPSGGGSLPQLSRCVLRMPNHRPHGPPGDGPIDNPPCTASLDTNLRMQGGWC